MNKPIVIHLSQSCLHFTHLWLYSAYTELSRWLWWLSQCPAASPRPHPLLVICVVAESRRSGHWSGWKITQGKKKWFSVLALRAIQTTTLEKWKKYYNSSIWARESFQAASTECLCFLISIFLNSTEKPLPRLHCLSWILVVFSSLPTLLFPSCLPHRCSPLGLSSSSSSHFKLST